MAPVAALLVGVLPFVAAYPKMALPLHPLENPLGNQKRTGIPPLTQSVNECNTGVICSTNFDAEDQYVDVSPGSGHEFIAPTATDLRGECPGLNAASNHGFLPRNGIPTITETITGLLQCYGMSPDLSGLLAVVAVALDGDYLTETWSIGGSYPATLGILSEPQGLLGAHNKYEGDASVLNNDAYLEDGDVSVFQLSRFENLYNLGEEYTLDLLRQHNSYVATYSVENNPHYFSAPFSGLVTPAAHAFTVNLLSNHSAEQPSGYLDRNTLKSFFSVSGPDNALVHQNGYEQFPLNWYKRPSTNLYTTPGNLADTTLTALAYPGTIKFGGNTGTVNSFAGVDLGDLTGGTYNSANIFEGNNLGCFFIQAMQAGLPDQLKGGVADIAPILSLVMTYTSPLLAELGCPELAAYNQGLFNQYPGYNDTAS